MRVALVHDRLNVFGGSEKVLGQLHDMFPDADVFTSIVDPGCLPESWRQWNISASALQGLPLARRHHRLLLPLIALYFERLDLSEYDLVISSSHCAAKAVVCKPHTFHLCYCHSPLRYAWAADPAAMLSRRIGGLGRFALAAMMHWAKQWDYCTAARVDHFVANSHNTKAHIRKYYRRESSVVYPGVDVDRFAAADTVEDYYLVLSRLVQYKRLDLAIGAANRLKRRLVVIGDGPEKRSLKRLAGPTVELRGQVSDDEVTHALSHCRALLFPGEEDFGLVPVEAQAAGKPVVAYGRGGATETVIDGVTGQLFYKPTVDALCEAILKLESLSLDPVDARRNAERFSISAFKNTFASVLDEVLPGSGASPALPGLSVTELLR